MNLSAEGYADLDEVYASVSLYFVPALIKSNILSPKIE